MWGGVLLSSFFASSKLPFAPLCLSTALRATTTGIFTSSLPAKFVASFTTSSPEREERLREEEERWESKYETNSTPWENEDVKSELVRVIKEEGIEKFKSAERNELYSMEFGCGTGRSTIYLSKVGFRSVGIDLSSKAIARANANKRAEESKEGADKLNCAFAAGNFFKLESLEDIRLQFPQEEERKLLPKPGERFDFIFDSGCYHVLRKIEGDKRVVDFYNKILREGGQVHVIAGNSNEIQEQHPPPTVSKDELLNAFQSGGFKNIWIREIRFDPTEYFEVPPLAWSAFFEKVKDV